MKIKSLVVVYEMYIDNISEERVLLLEENYHYYYRPKNLNGNIFLQWNM